LPGVGVWRGNRLFVKPPLWPFDLSPIADIVFRRVGFFCLGQSHKAMRGDKRVGVCNARSDLKITQGAPMRHLVQQSGTWRNFKRRDGQVPKI
jgi:hypothetical protein